MKKSYLFILPLIISITVLFCRNNKKEAENIPVFRMDSVAFSIALNAAINSKDSADLSFYNQIYIPKAFSSFWFNNIYTFTERTGLLNSFLEKSAEHGINPALFQTDDLRDLINKTDTTKLNYSQLAELELSLTKNYYHYAAGLQYGVFNPVELYPDDYFIVPQRPDSAFIRQIFSNPDSLSVYLVNAQPNGKEYKALQTELKKLKSLKDSTFTPIPLLSDKSQLKFGKNYSSIPLIARRLMITGELPFNSKYDSIYTKFDEKILKSLNRFRKKYNLLQDKEIGNPTIMMLNTNFETQYKIVAANLERLRWKPVKPISNKYVHVNLADMTLRTMRGDTLVQTMRVCVGEPPKHKTPLLYGKMYEVVVNPTWTVPNSIIINEISRKMVNNPSYLRRNNMKVYKNREEVSEYAVSWSSLSNKYQPYVIVQDAGPDNSLGRIKFNFSNPFNVYLHDTNAKSVFQRHYRAVSHGCVRVEKPLELAYFCLHDVDTTNTEQIEKRANLKKQILFSIGKISIPKTHKDSIQNASIMKKLSRVELNPGVTVILDYRTCYTDNTGNIQFCNDHYKMDSLLIAKLKP